MLPFQLVYHPGYNLNLGDHVFPGYKYRMVRERMIAERFAEAADFVEPTPARDEDVLLVHDREWVERLKHGTLTFFDILKLELPYSRSTVQSFWLAAGGTTLAARLALRDGIGFNVGGGFHHAFPACGEGFCAIHDVAVAIRTLQREGAIQRAMVVDCDCHQGNGTASIFAKDESVFTLSIHQLNNYPSEKPPSNIDLNLEDDTSDKDYLDILRAAYEPAFLRFQPQMVFYLAGADPFYQDQLGGLAMTTAGLFARDRSVIAMALRMHVPVTVALAGGYAVNLEDTVEIHVNTAKAALDVLERVNWKRPG